MKPVPLAEMSHATFATLLHSRFRVQENAPAPVELELLEATAHPPGATAPAPAGNFSLIFAGPLHPFLPQRTYRLEHDQLGAFDLFIVPIGKDQNGFQYQAIFNRSSNPGALASQI